MNKFNYLEKEEIIRFNEYVISQGKNNGIYGIQYYEGLETITEQISLEVFGYELYPTISEKAAYLLQKLTKKHIFYDGNKRTAILSTMVFLDLNGYKLNLDSDEQEALVLSTTLNPDTKEEMAKIAKVIDEHIIKK